MNTANDALVLAAVLSSATAQAQGDAGPTCDGSGGVEACDCLDNDCNGQTDESVGCVPPSYFCSPVFCQCLRVCGGYICEHSAGEFPCPGGYVCVHEGDYCYCEPSLCTEETCPAGFTCEQRMGGVLTCRSLCEGVACSPCEDCRLGDCVTSCATGEFCVDGRCQSAADGAIPDGEASAAGTVHGGCACELRGVPEPPMLPLLLLAACWRRVELSAREPGGTKGGAEARARPEHPAKLPPRYRTGAKAALSDAPSDAIRAEHRATDERVGRRHVVPLALHAGTLPPAARLG